MKLASEGRKGRAGLAAVVAGCVALTSVVVLTGAGDPNSGFKFTQSGHWIYNSAIGRVFHLDSATRKIDAQVPLTTGTPGAQVVQTDTDAYVLSQSGIDKFGKSDLSVADPLEAPKEQAIGLEAAGAAFAVYQQDGRVIRLGKQPATAYPGSRLGDPAVTSDGTLWVHRIDQNDLCQLPLTADRMTCPATIQKGHKGALTAFGSKAVFVDLTADRVYDLTSDGFGQHVDLSNDVPESALVAANDVDGRLAVVDRERSVVQLIGLPDKPGQKAELPITKPLRKGNYDKVASSGHGLALLDREKSDLVTVDRDGAVGYQKIERTDEKDPVKHQPNLFRGDDSQVYVQSGKGDRVVVVDDQGRSEPVKIGSEDDGTPQPPPVTPKSPPPTPKSPPPTQKPKQPEKPEKPPRTQEPPTHTQDPPVKKDPPKREEPDVPEKTAPPKKPTVQAGIPGVPSGVGAKFGTDGPTVSWRAASANGAPVTAYELSWTGGSKTVSGSMRSTLITQLAGKSGYYVTIRARNRVGVGPAVRTGQIKKQYAEAESPREVVVDDDGISGQLTLAWDRPTMGDGTFVKYTVSVGSATATPRVSTTTTKATIKGLKDGTKYLFYVRAITKAPNGDQLSGKWASLSASSVDQEQPTPRVVASRGAGTEYGETCKPPECAYIQVRIENLRPNTEYKIVPYVDGKQFNPGARLRTSSKGHLLVDDRFPCSMVGRRVYVMVTGPGGPYKSNEFTWKSG